MAMKEFESAALIYQEENQGRETSQQNTQSTCRQLLTHFYKCE